MDPQSSAQQLVGAVLNGRWRLLRLIGEGGMGAVYEGQGMRGEGSRAIKVLHPEFVFEQQIVDRFFAEAQAAHQLRHPNVAQIFDQGRAEDGTPYLVMELLSGAPLSSSMQPGRPMPPQQAAGIVMGVLQALAAAHARGIVHRDLKPDNLFLVPDGRGNQVVKVLDFGIAKIMDAAGGMGSKTKTGVLLGTPGYMSPEQIKNSKGVDPRSDLWSVGIIFYEMLSGREAFQADNEFARLTMVLTQDIKPIGEVAPHCAAWNGFFQRALAREPGQRFQSAQEMAQAIAALAAPRAAAPAAQAPATSAAGGTMAMSLQGPGGLHGGLHGGLQGAQAASAPGPMPGPSTVGSPHAAAPGPRSAMPGSQPYAPPQVVAHVQPSTPPPGMPSVPPPPAGPSTHVSMQRSGPPTLQAGSGGPAVELVSAPPVGVTWWVVGAVGAACFILGFVAGYFAG